MTNWNNTFTGSAVKPATVSYQALNIAVSTALAWPTETLEGVPYVAASIDVTATAGGLAVSMPDARNGATGVAAMFTNVGATTFVVNDSTGTQIASIAAGVAYVIILRDNSTQAGLWRAVQLAATTSNANAAALAGPGLQASGSTLQTNDVNTILAANTTLTTAHRGQIITWTGAAGTLTLDTLAHLGIGWMCWIINEGSGNLTLATSGADTINTGQASLVLPPGTGGACPSLRVSAAAGQFNASGGTTVPLPPASGGTGVVNDPTNTVAFTGHFSLGVTLQNNTQITLPTSGTLAVLGANTFTGKQTAPQLATSGNLSAAAWTTAGLRLALAAATLTDTSSNGVVAVQYADVHKAPTFAANLATTYTDAYNCYFEVPQAGGNVTLTRAWGLGADSLKVTGHVSLEGVISTGATGTGNLVFSIAPTITGKLSETGGQIAISGGVSAAAWTTAGIRLTAAAATFTDNTSGGSTVPNIYFDVHKAASLVTFNTAATYTNAYGVFCEDPIASTNSTFTNTWALGVNSLRVLGLFALSDVSAPTLNVAFTASSTVTLTANRTLTVDVKNASRTFTLGANLTVSGASTVNQDVSTAGNPSFVNLTATGTLAVTGVATLSGGARSGIFTQNNVAATTYTIIAATVPDGRYNFCCKTTFNRPGVSADIMANQGNITIGNQIGDTANALFVTAGGAIQFQVIATWTTSNIIIDWELIN